MISIASDVTKNRVPIFIENLLDFLPEPEKLDIKNFNGRIGIESIIPLHFEDISDYHLDHGSKIEERIVWGWRHMYNSLTQHVSKIFLGRDDYFVVKMTPLIYDDFHNGFVPQIKLRILVDINVAHTKNVTIAEWSFDPVMNFPIEWKCAGCSTPNLPEDRWCSQCGAPRALLIQEMMCVHCNVPRVDGAKTCSQCGAEYVKM